MIGIGIDTGGTCTDAVIYDFGEKAVLASAKTLTTHHDLKVGIRDVLYMLPQELLAQCGQAALSTTLATNACVEDRGGRGKIIFFGVSRKVFMSTFRDYGFRDPEDVLLVDCRILPDPADFSRLEAEGVILRCGLTPTDFMHVKGDFDAWCGEASRHAAAFFVRSSEAETVEALADRAYDLVGERLYKNIVRILLTTEDENLGKKPFDDQMQSLIDFSWQLARKGSRRHSGFLPWIFQTRASLIGVGAPTHVFLPRVAKMLHTQAVLTEHAAVANAVGAIAGQVTAIAEVEIRPATGEDYGDVLVVTPRERRVFGSRTEALSFARREGGRIVRGRAVTQGADGELDVREELIKKEAPIGCGTIWLGDVLRFVATGIPAVRSQCKGSHKNSGQEGV